MKILLKTKTDNGTNLAQQHSDNNSPIKIRPPVISIKSVKKRSAPEQSPCELNNWSNLQRMHLRRIRMNNLEGYWH